MLLYIYSFPDWNNSGAFDWNVYGKKEEEIMHNAFVKDLPFIFGIIEHCNSIGFIIL